MTTQTRYALNVDEPAVQAAIIQYLGTIGAGLVRVAEAVEQADRAKACEELVIVSLLVHYLRRRLTETAPDEGGD